MRYLLIILAAATFLSCGSRHVVTKKSKKVTETDSQTTSLTALKLVDTSRKQTKRLTIKNGTRYQELTVYARPGGKLTVGRDGTITGDIDSTRGIGISNHSSSTEVKTDKRTAKTIDQNSRTDTRLKQSRSEETKDKESDRESVANFLMLALIIVLAGALIIGGYSIKRKIN